MSILIKGIKIPQGCFSADGICFAHDGVECHCRLAPDKIVHFSTRVKNERPSWCPLIELPPHGDLIDRDEGIKIGAELAVMHGSDATTQELEKEYWRGYEDAMQRRDVKPVVHSKWSDEMVACRDEYGDFHFGYQCSVCGAILNRTNYCGACGAKMDL